MMRSLSIFALFCALVLGGCEQEAPAVAPDGQGSSGANDSAEPSAEVSGPERHILAFGNSLFAGYGVDKTDSYPAQLEASLRERGINAHVTNAGVSGDTTAAGLQRLEFTLDAQATKPDLFILELGGNDLLRAIPPETIKKNLSAMLDILKARDIKVIIMGLRSPPNYGGEFQQSFDALYPDLAKQYDAALVPFFLEAIYQEPKLFQSDRVHPTEAGILMLVKDTVDDVEGALPPAE